MDNIKTQILQRFDEIGLKLDEVKIINSKQFCPTINDPSLIDVMNQLGFVEKTIGDLLYFMK